MYKKIIFTAVALLGIAVSPVGVLAQQTGNLTPFNCFDTYQFGSVPVTITPQTTQVLAGSELKFNFSATNQNSYPIVDGSIYVKIFRSQTDSQNSQKNGGFIVDQFIAKENIVLNAQESKNFEYSWKVPARSPSGSYYAATFFQSAKKFNLSGLPFSDDVIGERAQFNIKSSYLNAVEIDKNGVTINEKPHLFAGQIPVLPKDGKVNITIPIKNSTPKTEKIGVSYTLYYWDGLLDSQKIASKDEEIELKPGETKKLSYEVSDTNYPVYYLVISSKWNDFKSIVDVRFAREGIEKPRISFPGITSFPIKNGTPTTFFACLHNSGGAESTPGSVKIAVTDSNGTQISAQEWKGDISNGVMGLKTDFTPNQDYGVVNLNVSILDKDGKIIEEAKMKYDCKEIDANNCSNIQPVAPVASPNPDEDNNLIYIIIGGIVLLLIVFGLILFFKKRKGGVNNQNYNFSSANTDQTSNNQITKDSVGQEPMTLKVLLGVLIIGGILTVIGFSGSNATADSYTWNYTYNGELRSDLFPSIYVQSHPPLGVQNIEGRMLNPTYKITYAATATDQNGRTINNGEIVPIGNKVVFSYDPNDFKTIGSPAAFWSATGGYNGTPYGYWVKNAALPSGAFCNALDELQISNAFSSPIPNVTINKIYAPLSVNPPKVSIDISNSDAGVLTGCVDSNSGARKTCNISGAGDIDARVIFDQTYAYHYSMTLGGIYDDPIKCHVGSKFNRVDGQNRPEFKLTIPTRTFNFNLIAQALPTSTSPTSTQNPPISFLEIPVITGPTTGTTDVNYTFQAFSTSSRDSYISYDFDWDNNGVGDVLVGPVSSTMPASSNFTWTIIGSKTIKVRAIAENGLISGWATHIINIVSPIAASCTPGETWTSCSVNCGGGTRNKIQIDNACQVKIIATEVCNTNSCGVTIREVRPG